MYQSYLHSSAVCKIPHAVVTMAASYQPPLIIVEEPLEHQSPLPADEPAQRVVGRISGFEAVGREPLDGESRCIVGDSEYRYAVGILQGLHLGEAVVFQCEDVLAVDL